MSRTFTMPELAESVVEGEIVKWLVAEGDTVAEDQALLEVMTDKVTVEIPSPLHGVLEAQLAAEGDVVPVGAPIARFAAEAGDASAAAASDEPGASVPAAEPEQDGEAPGTPEQRPAASADGAPAGETGGWNAPDDGSSLTLFKPSSSVDDGPLPQVHKPAGAGAGASEAGGVRGPFDRPLAVPAARKRARELGVELERVTGSGPHGRIRVPDVEAVAQRLGPAFGTHGPPGPDGPDGPVRVAPLRLSPDGPEETREPLRGLRRVIAKQMMQSHLGTVRTLHVDEADVSELVAVRRRLVPRAEARGVRLTYLPFFLRAVTASLMAYPMLNASLDDDTDEVVRYRDVHLSLAVSTDAGLMVPVIRDASRRSVLGLAAEANRLAAAARAGTLAQDEVRGGTFSVTNVGAIGGTFSFPIIHAPQAAILGVHAIKKRPVVMPDDTIAPRSMTYLSLSFDHRLVDGADAARFTNHLIDLLQAPETLLLDA